MAKATGLRVVGALHSWNASFVSEDTIVSLDRMPMDVTMSRGGIARVSAGISLEELYRRLWREGWALETVGGITRQSLAGAIATGTHGSFLGPSSVSAAVVGVRLITACGDSVTIDEQDARLPVARLALGTLGVMTEIWLRCVPAGPKVRLGKKAPLKEALSPSEEQLRDHFELNWFPFTGSAQLNLVRDTRSERALGGELRRRVEHALVTDGVFGALEAVGTRRPDWMPGFLRFAANVSGGESARVGRWYHTMTGYGTSWRADDIELALPASRLREAIETLRRLIDREAASERHFATLPINVRFSGPEPGVVLSPTETSGTTAYIDIPAYIDAPGRGAFLQRAEAVLLELGGRPHWAKTLTAYMPDHYPRVEEVEAVRRDLDPKGKLLNDFLRKRAGFGGS